MNVINAVVGLFDGGGELAEVNKKLRELKPVYPEHVAKNLDKAYKNINDVQFDKYRGDQVSFEEREVNRRIYAEAAAIINEKERIVQAVEGERKRLLEKRKEVETQLEYWRSRKVYLQEVGAAQYEGQHTEITNNLKWLTYTLQRDKAALVAEFNGFEAEIAALKEKRATLIDMEAIIEIEFRLREVEMQHQSFLINSYPKARDAFLEREKRVKELQWQLDKLESGHKEAIQQCDDEMIRLCGKILD